MKQLFTQVPANEYQTSGMQAPLIVQTYQERLLTGMVGVSRQPQDQVVLFLVEGNIVNGYRLVSGNWQRVSPEEWSSALDPGDVQMRVLSLPLDGIRFTKAYLECAGERQDHPIPAGAVRDRFQEWLILPQMTVASLRWETAEGMVIFPGRCASPSPILFVNRGQIVTGAEALETMLVQAEHPCQMKFCREECPTEAGQEYYLSLAFVVAVDRLLARYSELAGRSLLALLGEEINLAARVQGWRVIVLGQNIHDQEVFSSSAEAARAYRTLLDLCVRHIGAVIGQPLTEAVLQQVAGRLTDKSVRLLQTYQVFPLTDPLIAREKNEA